MKAALNLSCPISDRLLNEAVRFHGHIGPFLVLGLKAGLFANGVLGKDSFKTQAVVETDPTPPCSCIVDGIQIATGCTMGKGNIELKSGSSLSVTFVKGDKRLEICLKDKVSARLKKISTKDESEKTALTFVDKSIQDFFDIKK